MYQNRAMPSIVKILRAAADPNRLRILLLLQGEELSVAELQEILVMGQSTISTHLSQLKQAGLVEDRRTGKSNLYRLCSTFVAGGVLDGLLAQARQETPEAAADQAAMRRVVKKRQDKMRSFFDSVAGRLGNMEELPIEDAQVDLVFFSQSLHHALHPDRAVQEAARILRPGGRIVILDLAKHRFEEARELYADERSEE